MAMWIYDEKFQTGIQFLSGTLPFMTVEDDDLWAPGSRTRRAAHDDDQLWVPSRPQGLNDHVSSGRQATSYDKSDWQFSVTSNRDSIDNYPIIRVSP
jgi:hypothetical protein